MQAAVGDTVRSYSSINAVQEEFEFPLIAPQYSLFSKDSDNDGKVDEFEIEMKFSSGGQDVSGIVVILGFDLDLEEYVNANYHTLTFIRLNSPAAAGIGKAEVFGTMNIEQRSAISVKSGKQEFYDESLPSLMQKYSIDELQEIDMDRNVTTRFDSQSIISPYSSTGETTINMKITVPGAEEIHYEPAFAESFKFAWIKYAAMVAPVAYILFFGVLERAIKGGIFDTNMLDDLPKDLARAYLY